MHFKWPRFQPGVKVTWQARALQPPARGATPAPGPPLPPQRCPRPATLTPASMEAPVTPTTTRTRASVRAASTAGTASKVAPLPRCAPRVGPSRARGPAVLGPSQRCPQGGHGGHSGLPSGAVAGTPTPAWEAPWGGSGARGMGLSSQAAPLLPTPSAVAGCDSSSWGTAVPLIRTFTCVDAQPGPGRPSSSRPGGRAGAARESTGRRGGPRTWGPRSVGAAERGGHGGPPQRVLLRVRGAGAAGSPPRRARSPGGEWTRHRPQGGAGSVGLGGHAGRPSVAGAAGPAGRVHRLALSLCPSPQPGHACAARGPAATGARARRRAASTSAAAPTASPAGTARSVRCRRGARGGGGGGLRGGRALAGGGGGRAHVTPRTVPTPRGLCFQGSRTRAPPAPVTTEAPAFTTLANTSVTAPPGFSGRHCELGKVQRAGGQACQAQRQARAGLTQAAGGRRDAPSSPEASGRTVMGDSDPLRPFSPLPLLPEPLCERGHLRGPGHRLLLPLPGRVHGTPVPGG